MVQVLGRHYYLYEPVQLGNSKLVIPCHFYVENSTITAKCVKLFINRIPGSNLVLLKMKTEPHFSSNQFMNIPTCDFWRPYPDIRLEGECLLSNICGSVLWGKHVPVV